MFTVDFLEYNGETMFRLSLFDRPHNQYERQLAQEGYALVAGIDEVGRGAWAGPILACALIMPCAPRVYGVNDSKKLSPRKRAILCERIRARAKHVGIGTVSHQEIDDMGIVRANEEVMMRAIADLHVQPDFLLIDAFDLAHIPVKQTAIAHGDAIVYSIAAASIVAKVARDTLMEEYHERYPEYGFFQHKGYGTREHQSAIGVHGLSPIHRLSFQPMKSMV